MSTKTFLNPNAFLSKRWSVGIMCLLCLGCAAGGCGDGDSPTDDSHHLEAIQIESLTRVATSSDLCALDATLRNLTNKTVYLLFHFHGLRSGGAKAAFAVIEGALAPYAAQMFEGVLYPRTLMTWDRPASCAAMSFELDAASIVRFKPTTSADRGLEKIEIQSTEHDQLARMCRLNIVVQPRQAEQADLILRYSALDREGNQIAAAFFAAMLENVATPLFCTWISPSTGSALQNCSDIASVEIDSSSIVF